MPTYDYECIECGHRFEHFQKMSDAPLDVCLNCSGQVRRLLSGGSGLIFKGSGFYITDYAKKNNSQSKDQSKTNAGSKASKASDNSSKDPK